MSNTPSKRSRIKRFLIGCLWALLIVALLVFALLAWLLTSDSGVKQVSRLANQHVPGLEISQISGTLRSGLNADQIHYKNDSIDVKANGLKSDWHLGCLLQSRLCVDQLHLDSVHISTQAPAQAPTEPPPRVDAIALPEIVLPLALELDTLTIDKLHFQAPGDVPEQVVENIQLTISAESSDIALQNLSLDYQDISAQLSGDATLSGAFPLDLSLVVNAQDALPDELPEGTGLQPLDLQASIGNTLESLQVNAQIRGSATADVTIQAQPLQPNLPADITLTSEELGWPLQSRSIVLARDARIKVSGDLNDYQFSIATDVSGEQLPDTRVSISGLANPERVTVPQINLGTLGGQMKASALTSLSKPIVWSTQWDMSGIDPSLQLPGVNGNLNANITASGTVNDGRWSLKIPQARVDGTLRDLPFELDAKVSKGLNDFWFIEQVLLSNDRNQLKAQGIVGDTIDIKSDINLNQLQNFMPGLAGGFDARINVQGDPVNPDITVDADADVLKINDILVRSLQIDGNIAQLFEDDSAVDVQVDTVRIGQNTISNTALSLNGSRAAHQLALNTQGPQDTALNLTLNGALDETLNWDAVVDSVQAALPAHNVTLADPVNISWNTAEQQANVQPHCWQIEEQAMLCLNEPFANSPTGRTSLSLNQYSLDKLDSFMPDNTAIAGLLEADVELTWGDAGATDKRAIVSARLNDAQLDTVDALGDPLSVTYESITLDVNAQPDDATAQLLMRSQSLGEASIELQLDPSNKDSDIIGRVDLQGLQVNIAEAFLPDFDEVSGTISAEGDVAGKLTEPVYSGTVTLNDPIVRSEILPLPITGGTVTARITEQQLALNGEILSDEGRVDISGRGTLNPDNWSAKVNLKGRELNVQSDPLQNSTINHDISIDATPRRIAVTGNIDVPQAVIDVAELPEGAATVSSDVVIIEEIEAVEEQAPTSEVASDSNLNVALTVSLGDDVSLSAYGLNANLTGDMDVRIRGARPPQLGGDIRVVDGIYKQYGQDLEANGQILFVGPIDSTRLDIDAVREIDGEDRIAGLRIQGTVATPEITLFTDPSDKSQDAILSYVVLGRDINEASDQESDLLAAAALALAVRGGKTVGSNVASRLGVDEFGLETRGRGNDTELVVSGRLNDRLLLRYGRGVFDAESTLYLRYDLTKKLYLEAAQGAQEAVDLFYSFAF